LNVPLHFGRTLCGERLARLAAKDHQFRGRCHTSLESQFALDARMRGMLTLMGPVPNVVWNVALNTPRQWI
jgi:hypothetical protein